ncbi:hypothetical protein SAY87_010487 [Trapa incisa]|uniref:non-specific serine/threonine protein kinase n=1 Tax=Trapa incisa TaxID=236973 RepID=A0AAN7JI69_9MYRT|nr:hypothetical protein SAY87_010487 [Trapa incisa]
MYMGALLRLILLCAFFLRLHGNDTVCSPKSCHGREIRYPFSELEQDRNVYCSYPGFILSCPADGTHPILTISPNNSYQVTHINYSTQSITLVDIDAVGNRCPRIHHNITIDNMLQFHYNKNNKNITFYYNCSFNSTYLLPVKPIQCSLEDFGNNSYVVLDGTETASKFNRRVPRCEEVVTTTVQKAEVSELELREQFVGAMGDGFVLNWYTAEDCRKCESQRGRCAFNNRTKEFMCYCSDRSLQPNSSNGTYCKAGGGTALILLVAFFVFLQYNKRRKSDHPYLDSRSTSSANFSNADFQNCGLHIFHYDELRDATDNFDPQKQLGDGGFGCVYHGRLPDGRAVAVKRLFESNCKRAEQFTNEVEILSRLRHPNLVQLYGCTPRKSHKLLLVYEYIPNGTLADHLHGDLAKPGSLPWCTRLNIAVETASALVYLHASDIIHRDVKTNNILLDENFSVKVADFGISRLFPFNVTHVSTVPQGTPGYLDPEYHKRYQLTDKSDVYSFGVVLMELISSLPAVDIEREENDINLSSIAINKIRSHTICDIVDQNLGFDSNCDTRRMIMAVVELGFRCLQTSKDMRPTMAEVLQNLKDIQKQGSDEDKVTEEDTDYEAVFLKAKQSMHSPISVIEKLESTNTTPNVSG